MNLTERIANYTRQSGSYRLTSAQAKRCLKKLNQSDRREREKKARG